MTKVEKYDFKQLTLRLNCLPKILLVKVKDTETAYRAYWSGHWLGTVGRLRSRNIYGWKMSNGSDSGQGGDQGKALMALWKCWEEKYGEKESEE